MRFDRFIGYFVPVALAVYAVIGFSRIRTTDLIPFSAWALFVFVPNAVTNYTVQIIAVDKDTLPKPIDYSHADGLVPDAHDIQAYYLINHFGMAWEKGDRNLAMTYRLLFEANGLKKNSTYALIENQYDPIDRWKTGAMRQKVVSQFTNSLP